ncbi:arsenate reductase ArsC [Noviherbaspirillum pedocola]|uniref:Arsenate reductase ArsC n=1 Tax=Noviherbaspirillum pedocola TaxID=2801341 RepID=A0A934T2K0_9BURK|nr:arsenate reductase ArsC [Noviherbaspirillum pedocola]MBK4738014.1 arsenate reductase ArsC [Noviherbaspirillum pedocola]
MTEKTFNVLFLCTGNSARSIMAEALATTMSKGNIRGHSAGSKPGGTVNPFAIEKVKAIGYPVESLRSKSWEEFARLDAPQMDFIITVCDNAAGEACPVWPGRPATAHWSFEDPAAVQGSDEHKRAAFSKIFGQIKARMERFVGLPIATLDKAGIERELRRIGDMPIASA